MRLKFALILLVIVLVLIIGILNNSLTRGSSHITIFPAEQDNENISLNKNIVYEPYVFKKPYYLVFHGLNTPSNWVNSGQFKINVFVEEKSDLGFLGFIPFKKSIKIKSLVKYSWNHPLKSANPTERGLFEIRGRFRTAEVESRKEAILDVQNFLDQNIRDQIETEIQSALSPE